MPNLPYKTSGWDTHSEAALPEVEFPLLDVGCPDHFTIMRAYEGPLATYSAMALDTVDRVFSGVARSVTGTASTDKVLFSSAHELFTGCAVTLAVSSGLAGLSAGTYYAIVSDSTNIKLATTYANAIAGTAVNITSDGTGTITPPTAYLVRQSALRDIDAGCVRYERIFANVPSQWSEPESFAYTFPAVAAASVGTSQSVSAIVASGSNFVLTVGGDPGLISGDSCYISLRFTRGGGVYQYSAFTKATASSTGATATIAGVLAAFGSGAFSSVSGTIVKGSKARTVSQLIVVGSRVVSDYALSTIATLDTNLPLSQPFTPVIASSGTVTDTITTSTTSPTAAEYATLVVNGSEIVAEPPVRRRYMGNIFVRTTRLIPAT